MYTRIKCCLLIIYTMISVFIFHLLIELEK